MSAGSIADVPGDGLYAFAGRRILLLQGPVGPFFRRFAHDLRWAGATVHKVNFNAGDWLFDPVGATNFDRPVSEWEGFLEALIRARRIDAIMLYGDCRPIHRTAIAVAHRIGVEAFVFEEGYVRPDYVTFERWGVNGHSHVPRNPIYYLNADIEPAPVPDTVGPAFWHAAGFAVLYYLAAFFLRPMFRHHNHHRPLDIRDGLSWTVSLGRKFFYGWLERDAMAELVGEDAPPFFLVPLQVFNDAQVTVHSRFGSVPAFIAQVAASFAANAPSDALLVFKHHPMDRGYVDYSRLIRREAPRLGIAHRVRYIHDQHLPTLLGRARGLVTINSTVGMSALLHEVPTITLGAAYYDFAGLTFQRGLDAFWTDAHERDVNIQLYLRFRAFLVRFTQVNGNFYRRLPGVGIASGMRWQGQPRAPLGQGIPAEIGDAAAR